MSFEYKLRESVNGSVFVTPWIIFCKTSLSMEFSFNEVDETGAYNTEQSKSERERQILYINAYISNFKDGTLILHAAAAAAKSLQSCPTLCNPIDGSPPGFPIPGILQARTLEWVAISFSNA